MTHIKSAFEIALERTEDVKGDKETILVYELKNEGMKLVSEALRNPEKAEDLKNRAASLSAKDRTSFMEGVSSALLSNISLPSGDDFEDTLETLRTVFLSVSSDKKRTNHVFNQLKEFIAQFVQNRKQLENNLMSRYEPRLRQKEEELYKRMGAKVHLEPMQDPEFVSLLNENRTQLEERYSQAMNKAKAELHNLL